MAKCAACDDREVSAGTSQSSLSAKSLDLCMQCWKVQKIRGDRANVLGVTLRAFVKRGGNARPRSPKPAAAPAARRDQNVPQGYESFEDLVRAIARDELRRLLEAAIDGK